MSGLVRSVDWTSGLAALGHGYCQRRYTILFYSLLLTMVSVPLFGAMRLEAGLVELFLAAKLLATIVPMGGRNERRLLLVILLSVALIMRLSTGGQ